MMEIQVGLNDLDRLVAAGKRAVEIAVELNAREVLSAVEDESASASSRVADSWSIREAGDERIVKSSEFFAHFLARGTRAHGPKRKKMLAFKVNGDMVFAHQVSGISADPFDKRAIARAESMADSIIRRAVEQAA